MPDTIAQCFITFLVAIWLSDKKVLSFSISKPLPLDSLSVQKTLVSTYTEPAHSTRGSSRLTVASSFAIRSFLRESTPDRSFLSLASLDADGEANNNNIIDDSTSATSNFIENGRNRDAKKAFFDSLDRSEGFNTASKTRTALLDTMTTQNPTIRPGSLTSFNTIAPGTWRIIYAPHISTLSSIAGGSFDPVLYDMTAEGLKIVSHAKYNFPILGEGWLSVSGTYGSLDDDRYCQVGFNRAWIGVGSKNKIESFEDAPETSYKGIINSLGKLGFRKEFAVFPVSYLDEDTIVFDFELFGTRICAKKVPPSSLGLN